MAELESPACNGMLANPCHQDEYWLWFSPSRSPMNLEYLLCSSRSSKMASTRGPLELIARATPASSSSRNETRDLILPAGKKEKEKREKCTPPALVVNWESGMECGKVWERRNGRTAIPCLACGSSLRGASSSSQPSVSRAHSTFEMWKLSLTVLDT
jgi:hypothetical protein